MPKTVHMAQKMGTQLEHRKILQQTLSNTIKKMRTSLVWFTNNLRVTDNYLLSKACKSDRTLAIYCFDPRQFEQGGFGFVKTGRFRAKFLLQSVMALRENLAKLNISLLVFLAKPEDIIPKVAQDHQVNTLYFQKEWTRDELKVIKTLKKRLKDTLEVKEYYDQFLFHPDDVPYATFEELPDVFTNFRKKCEKHAPIRPTTLIPQKKSEENLVENTTKMPVMADLGHDDFEMDARSAFPFRGGENAAKQRLQHYFWETKKLSHYKKTRNGLIGTEYSSKFSPWLANGCISAKTIYHQVKKYEAQIKKNQDTYWLVFELVWRDYFKYVSLKYGDQIFTLNGILNKQYDWGANAQLLKEWTNGQTDEPFVNANMLELKHTGWMSNRGRQNVASYWAKHLKQDWRVGAAYFEHMLVDYDVHSNWGNWMYNSGVGNDPRDRIFNIKGQTERYDPDGKFQQLWLQQRLF